MKLKVKRGRIYGNGREPIAYSDWEIRDGYRIIATFKTDATPSTPRTT